MRFNTRLAAAVLGMFATAAPAHAQFEGIVTLSDAMAGPLRNAKMYIKGASLRMEIPNQHGVIITTADGRVMSVMQGQHAYMVLARGGASVRSNASFESLGKNEVIAGLPCSYYRIHDPGTQHDGVDACVTQALGYSGLGRGNSLGDFDANQIREKFPKGFFILKSSNAKGTIISQVAKVERAPLSDDLFAPPAGYTEIKMPGIGRGAPGRP